MYNYTANQVSAVKTIANLYYQNLPYMGFSKENQETFKQAIRDVYKQYGDLDCYTHRDLLEIQKNRLDWMKRDFTTDQYMSGKVPDVKNFFTTTHYALVVFEYAINVMTSK